jgi:hypothetical protein
MNGSILFSTRDLVIVFLTDLPVPKIFEKKCVKEKRLCVSEKNRCCCSSRKLGLSRREV